MALTNDLIQPAAPQPGSSPLAEITPAPTATAPATTPAAPKAPKMPELPEEVQKNPVVKEVLQGKIPGVLVRPNIYYPKAYKLAENYESLLGVGLDFYFAKDESTALFNPAKISEQELQAADQKGMLTKVLPDYETLSGERPQKPPKGVRVGYGLDQPGGIPPTPGAGPGGAAAGSPAMIPPAGGNLDNKLATKRVQNLNVASAGPTSGPNPGAGRVINTTAISAV